jgi:hypothetical protein
MKTIGKMKPLPATAMQAAHSTASSRPSYLSSSVAQPDASLHQELRKRLLALPYQAFARCMAILLESLGYEEVQLAGRTERIGHNRDGGCDLTAWLPGGLGRRRVVVQVKQYDGERLIFRRSVDELRGVCLRANAAEALLLTTGALAPSLSSPKGTPYEEDATGPFLPVRLVDGDTLVSLMISHRIGTWEEAGENADQPARRGIDVSFFESLENGTGRIIPARQEQVSRYQHITTRNTPTLPSTSMSPMGAMPPTRKAGAPAGTAAMPPSGAPGFSITVHVETLKSFAECPQQKNRPATLPDGNAFAPHPCP